MNKLTADYLRIGVIGCGNISTTYIRNAPLFKGLKIIACADHNMATAAKCAETFNLKLMGCDELLNSPEIDLVLNLTTPNAHYGISKQALDEGKHVFTEKPLSATAKEGRLLVENAHKKSLFIGSAPDTFLGAAGRFARGLVEEGAIGEPVTGSAFMMGRGMEHWHPDPSFYYQPGGGPVLDMGPYYLTMLVNLIGPVKRVQTISSSGQTFRTITAEGPKVGTTFTVGTPTSVLSLLEFKSGTTITFCTSWDVFKHSNSPIELHGTKGSLSLPDPDTFGGLVRLSREGQPWEHIDTSGLPFGAANWPMQEPSHANYRMLGLADLAKSMQSGRSPRTSATLALHVLEVMESILKAGEEGVAQTIPESMCQPEALSEKEAVELLA